jgi:hypothetical protein
MCISGCKYEIKLAKTYTFILKIKHLSSFKKNKILLLVMGTEKKLGLVKHKHGEKNKK